MSPARAQKLTYVHQIITVWLLPACFGLLLYIAKGVYENGQENSKAIVRINQVDEDQNKTLDRHEHSLVDLKNAYQYKGRD